MSKIRRSRNLGLVVQLAVFFAFAISCFTSTAAAQSFGGNVKDVYFPFNIYSKVIDPATLDANANYLKQNPDTKMWIQGFADPRGDVVYNLVLSYRRAQWVKSQFVKRGVDASRIEFATGWGKLYQTCTQADDACFQQNRRVDVVSPESMMFHGGQ